MATKKTMNTPVKKYAEGGSKDCVKKKCSDMEYWRQDLCRCVRFLSADSFKHPPSENDIMIKKQIKALRGETKPLTETVRSAGEGVSNIASQALLNAAKQVAKKKSKMGGATYKTGGMVNSNSKLVAAKSAGSKGVKAGVNPKAAASNVAKKPSKPRSKAPKKAKPGRG
jgi:hypothetical protein